MARRLAAPIPTLLFCLGVVRADDPAIQPSKPKADCVITTEVNAMTSIAVIQTCDFFDRACLDILAWLENLLNADSA